MATHETLETLEPKTLGLLAEFPGPDELVAAAEKTTDSGYRRVDAYSSFPIHGIDDALKARRSRLPWIVFLAGLTGMIVALLMQWYMNAVEGPWDFSGYEYRISGKPYFSLPANIPITFELIVLFSSFGAFFGMLALNGLPRLSNPLFKNERFATATSHGFFLWVDAKDNKFSDSDTASYLSSIGATAVEPVHDDTTGKDVPGFLLIAGAVAAVIGLVPPLWVAAAAGESTQPRLSIWWDMDYQPKFKPQQGAPLSMFADGIAMRKSVPGTVARGALLDDLRYYRGYEPEPDAIATAGVPTQFVSLQAEGDSDEGETPSDGQSPAEGDAAPAAEGEPPAEPEPNWLTELPIEVTPEAMERGQQRFNIYCAACHGEDGGGQGLVTRRAQRIQQMSTWTIPTDISSEGVRTQPVGKLFHSISYGVRRMPGYAQQISAEDRWAIVLYVRAIQRASQASLEDVPERMREGLRNP